jgi:hypothetical protein
MNKFYIRIQQELPNKLYNINQQNTETMEDLDDVRKITSETKKAVIAYL